MKSNRKTKTLILIIIGIFFTFSSIFTTNLYFKNSEFSYDNKRERDNMEISAVSGKIHIDCNSDWAAFEAEGNCTGKGTYSEPYVIEDLIIDANGSGSGILIENSDVFFRIENCTVNNSGYNEYGYINWTAGIKLFNCTRGKLINNSCSFNYIGIYLSNSVNISVLANNITYNYQGVYINQVVLVEDTLDMDIIAHNLISGNIVSHNTRYGISLLGGRYNNVSGNTANNNGNYAAGIYLINSGDNIISGNTANNNYRSGIVIEYYCDHNLVCGNTANNNGIDGVRVFRSFNNTISENTVIENDNNGIGLAEGDYNNILRNTANNNEIGINLWNGEGTNYYNTLSGNVANYNDVGIAISGCTNHLISENNASFNSNAGIILGLWKESDNNEITGNTANNNSVGIQLLESDYNIVSGNALLGNHECIVEVNCQGNYFSDNGDCTYGQGNGGIPTELIIIISIISGGAVIGVASMLLIRRKSKRIL